MDAPLALCCLGHDTLLAMADGALAAERIDRVIAHVDGCARCAEVVAELGALDGAGGHFGRYQLDRVIGVGGMGIVYAAYDVTLERRVALKRIRPERTTTDARAAMFAEARTLARISHPNVVAVFDVGAHDGEIYLATELVEGTTLQAWQAEPRTTHEVIAVWLQVARGLAAAHALEVVHSDIKPANVLIGDDGRVRIGDFGLARRATSALSARVSAGTPAYMAPEHRAGLVDARSDQFSACVAIVEALTGQRPEADVAPPIEPPALAAVLWRGLRADPGARYPTMTAFADALEAAIAHRVPRWIVLAAFAAAALLGGLVTEALSR